MLPCIPGNTLCNVCFAWLLVILYEPSLLADLCMIWLDSVPATMPADMHGDDLCKLVFTVICAGLG